MDSKEIRELIEKYKILNHCFNNDANDGVIDCLAELLRLREFVKLWKEYMWLRDEETFNHDTINDSLNRMARIQVDMEKIAKKALQEKEVCECDLGKRLPDSKCGFCMKPIKETR